MKLQATKKLYVGNRLVEAGEVFEYEGKDAPANTERLDEPKKAPTPASKPEKKATEAPKPPQPA